MGADKATLIVDGVAMAQRLRQVLEEAGIADIVEAGSVDCPDEESERQGPMAGIVAGWRHLQTHSCDSYDPTMVLSCDLPRLNASTVRSLIKAARQHDDGAVAHDGERMQPLVAAYRPSAYDEFERAYAAGERSVRKCFPVLDVGVVACDPSEIADADTPLDLIDHTVSWPPNDR